MSKRYTKAFVKMLNERIDKKCKRYTIALMNNTKWKKVLNELVLFGLPFQISCIDEERWGPKNLPDILYTSEDLANDHIRDVLIGGPVYYKQIFAIRIFRSETLINPKTGRRYQSTEKSDIFLKKINEIGKLPIELDDEFIYIIGYKK